MKRVMKAQLVRNALTPEANDYVAMVDGLGSVSTADIVNAMKEDGMEVTAETALNILTRFGRKSIELVLRGYSINTGLMNMHATIKGPFYSKAWNPDVNKLHVSIAQGIELRKAVAECAVEIIGEKAEPIAIFGIVDKKTGATDGTITRGFNAELRGSYIKVTGDNPACGVHLRSMADQTDTQLPADCIVLNEPSRLLLILPASLATGTYELSVTTQFSGSTKPLKQPRTATLLGDVTVADAAAGA